MSEDGSIENINAASLSTAVYALPSELLVQIFSWVCDRSWCTAWDCINDITEPSTALNLSLVCPRWRRIVRDTPTLWSHIDLFVHRLNDPKHLAYVKIHMILAPRLPLDIHVVDRVAGPSEPSDSTAFWDILDLAAPRTRSLSFQQEDFSGETSYGILYHCLGNSVPGMLKELNIVLDDRSLGRLFIEAGDSDTTHSHDPIVLRHTPKKLLEPVFLSVITLRLCGIYPYWKSSVYRGLVELCLHYKQDGSRRLNISYDSLSRVLSSSPKLQILDLDIHLTDLPEEDSPPIYLNDLRILRTGLMSKYHFGYLLKSLFPGSYPFTICCRGYPIDDFVYAVPTDANITDFFARTNVERLWLQITTYSSTLDLLKHAPNARELALSGLFPPEMPYGPGDSELDRDRYLARVDVLYLLSRCTIEMSDLKRMLRFRHIPTLLIHQGCELKVDNLTIPPPVLEERLSEICFDFGWLTTNGPHGWGIPCFPNKIFRT